MFIEIIQLIRMLLSGSFYYLPIHMILFIVIPLVVREIMVRRYSREHSLSRRDVRVSAVVPEYGEDIETFKRCLSSIAKNNPDEIIVVHDDCKEEIRMIAEAYGAKVISLHRRVGKRTALAIGWEAASGDIIVQVDSDVELGDGAIEEIIKPFADRMVVGVQGKIYVRRCGSWLSHYLSQIIEANRDLNNKALNGCLVVIDGRFCAWRRSWLLSIKDNFLNERFLGQKCEIGDDRFLTQQANLQNYKTCYQDTASATSATPETFLKFIKQQLRWSRSGYKAFIMDIAYGFFKRAPLTYSVFQFSHYLSPLSFTLAILHDFLFTAPILDLPWWIGVFMAILGTALIAYLRRVAARLYSISLKGFFLMGVTSLFIAYPLMLYALATIKKQNMWMTR